MNKRPDGLLLRVPCTTLLWDKSNTPRRWLGRVYAQERKV